ncbi:MAG: hypothetical protein HEQ27_18930 [Dolichospermum sp. JUN01]|jgi:hypothetical protein|nr:hypothetical protein [Dolichospermum sp. JUN01]QSV53113.1 MAG: hypothetical protein HEP80_03470 [Dolichospermum sp. UKL201]
MNTDEFVFDRRDFMLNCLTLGIAVEIFSKISGKPMEDCLNFLVHQAERRMARETPESIDEFIDDYHLGKQNKAKAIITNFPKPA